MADEARAADGGLAPQAAEIERLRGVIDRERLRTDIAAYQAEQPSYLTNPEPE